MASFPPLPQIVGSHGGIFEAYYKQADPTGTGNNVLSQVWELSDPHGKGYLEKSGFFVALKLISLVQNGQELNVAKIVTEAPPPNLGPVEVVPETVSGSSVGTGVPWSLQPSEKSKYDTVFDSLLPVNGLLSGDKVRPVLLNSKLPMDMLSKIWDLGDIDKDGYLDKDEFAVAMHLVYRTMEKDPLPVSLPPQLIPPSKRKKGPPAGAVQVLPGALPIQHSERADSPGLSGNWVVTATDKTKSDVMFRQADLDQDGFVSGQEIRSIFLQSGIPNTVLAHIWSLCDMKSIGKLNSEQFALAMYLVHNKIKGIDPPAQLSLEMIPPSMRPKSGADPAAFGVKDGTNAGPYSHVADFSAIKELDLIAKEIDDMKREKMQIEKDRAQREADIKICQAEVQNLQKELDAITATMTQLENQKKEAQKRLDELDDKKSNLESNVKEMREKCEEEEKQIDMLKSQINNQEKSVKDQEEELNSLRVELSKLRDEERKMETKVESGKQELESLSKSQRDLQIQVSQTRARVTHLEDQQRLLKQNIAGYTSQLNGEVSSIMSTPQTGVVDDQISSRATIGSPVSNLSNVSSSFSTGSGVDDFKDFKEDPFKDKDPFAGTAFPTDDPFKGNAFKSEGFSADPFASEDPFKDAFGPSSTASKPKDDPFGSFDPFGGTISSPSLGKKKAPDAFDPFGTGATSAKPSENVSSDLFGSDPFAPMSSTSRNESPKPALPPKTKKHPPPRPAPPRPRATPSPKPDSDPFSSDPFAGNDPFAGSGTGSGKAGGASDPFANFADFSPNKFEVGDDDWANNPTGTITIRPEDRLEQERADRELAIKLSQEDLDNESQA
ncbi:hypothetical protein ScPMuIL_006894 [Solemya velum]